jgi:alkylation response protein AidB-like acyl-CoA dehydrogenase
MAGAIVQLLGDAGQRRGFFGQLDEQPTWTFLALTEPGSGSDAANMRASLTEDGDRFLLTGAKRYVGNATRAGPGVVFARTGSGPLGVRAVLLPAPAPGFTATALPTLGLRGALLAAIEMDAVEIAPEWLLGRHLSSTRRGILSWVQTFNRIRPRVAAMGLGLARAAYDYTRTRLPAGRARDAGRLAELGLRIDAVRQLVWHAAAAVDIDPANGHLPAAAKAQAARLAEDVTLAATELLGPAARLEHPLLDKLVRDARGVEFMEGAGQLQKIAVARSYQGGRRQPVIVSP